MDRRLFLTTTTALVTTALIPGCATPENGNGGTFSPDRVYKVSKLAAYLGFKAQLLRDPSSRTVLVQISTVANELVLSQQWDLTTLAATLVANGMADLNSDEAQIALTGIPLFIDLFYGDKIDLRQSEYAEAFIKGAAEGFNMALGAMPAGSTLTRSAIRTMPTGPDEVMARLSKEAKATR